MKYMEQYYPYKDLCETGKQTIETKDLNSSNINQYFYGVINILKDYIETDEVKNMMIHIKFQDNEECDLTVFDYVFNLIFWQLNTDADAPIYSYHIFFPENITKRDITRYINGLFIDEYRTSMDFIKLNNSIDDVFSKFRDLRPFQMYLANSLNLEDFIILMNKYPEFDATMHYDPSNTPLADVKSEGLKLADTQIKYIENSNHCLRDSFRTGEAISPKQYKEVAVNIGTKPDGNGSIFPHPISHSFMNGGLQTPEDVVVDSSVGRIAQILTKTNVGTSGAFARQLELNNQDTFLNPDPTYVCDTHNFEEITIVDKDMLKAFDMRWYRTNPNGLDYLLNAKKDKALIGKRLYFRSPMTCESAAKGHGICYKCYGNLAYVNSEVNVGEIASEALSSRYTQTLLSAKHLLESAVIKMEWNTPEFYDIFEVQFNTLSLHNDKIYRGMKMIIDEEIKTEEELDDIDYTYYINNIIIQKANGERIDIHTSDSDNIYFDPEFLDYVNTIKAKSATPDNDDDYIELNMVDLMSFDILFVMEVKNNELSSTMNHIKKLIDNKTVISEYDRNSILQDFIAINIAGGIKLNAVHFEVLLMNQIRCIDDEIEMPDWSIPNEKYQILTLTKALSNNRSIAIRLQSDKVPKTLLNPQNDRLYKPAMADLFYMEQPQDYLGENIVSDDYKPKSDKNEILARNPFRHVNKK